MEDLIVILGIVAIVVLASILTNQLSAIRGLLAEQLEVLKTLRSSSVDTSSVYHLSADTTTESVVTTPQQSLSDTDALEPVQPETDIPLAATVDTYTGQQSTESSPYAYAFRNYHEALGHRYTEPETPANTIESIENTTGEIPTEAAVGVPLPQPVMEMQDEQLLPLAEVMETEAETDVAAALESIAIENQEQTSDIQLSEASENTDIIEAEQRHDDAMSESPWISDKPASGPAIDNAEPQGIVAVWKYLEQQFASRWMVWIGGIIMALGVIFLVKIGNDNGLFGPKIRIGIATLFGVMMTAGGELLRRSRFHLSLPSGQYIPAALSGAGVISLYASMLAANYIYGMFSLSVMFIILAIISAVAMFLALTQGPFMAALGILGAYMVPMFISTGSGNVSGLLGYVFLVTAGSLGLLSKIYRRWLWWGAMAGNYLWLTVAIFINPAEHQIARGLFILLTTYGFLALPHFGWRLSATARDLKAQYTNIRWQDGMLTGSVAALLLALMPVFGQLGLFTWITLWIGCIALLLLGKRIPSLNWLSVISSLVAGLVLISLPSARMERPSFLSELTSADYLSALICLGSLAIIYAAYGFYQARQKGLQRELWATLSTAAPMLLVIGLYYWQPASWYQDYLNISHAVIVSVALTFGACWYYLADIHRKMDNTLRAIYFIFANLLIVWSLFEVFSQATLTLLLAIQLLVSAVWISRRRIPVPNQILQLLMALILIRLTFNMAVLSYQPTLWGMPWTLLGYGIPVICLWLTAYLLPNKHYETSARWAQANGIYLLALWINIELRHLLHGSYQISLDFSSLKDVALHASTFGIMALAYGYKSLHARFGLVYRVGASAAGAITLFLTLLGSLMVFNPAITAQSVGALPLLNIVTVAYGLPALMLFVTLRYWPNWLPEHLKPLGWGLFSLLGMVFISMTVRQLWHGDILSQRQIYVGEQYCYSLAWMITAIGLMTLGITRNHLLLRRAALALLAVTILKLFLWDMSGLTGFYRPVSFIGLGLCLVGMGWFYQRFVIMEKPQAEVEVIA